MDDEMIERVALAISESKDPDNILTIHRDRAKLAIKAMREPTEKMIDAVNSHPDYLETYGDDSLEWIYNTMVDSITND